MLIKTPLEQMKEQMSVSLKDQTMQKEGMENVSKMVVSEQSYTSKFLFGIAQDNTVWSLTEI